jgi:hypothetical protein
MQTLTTRRNERKKSGFTALLVDAATLAMCPIALNGVQRLIGDVEEATQVIALDRVLFACDKFWLIAERIQETANTLEVLLIRSRCTRIGVVAVHGLVPSCSLMTHTDS